MQSQTMASLIKYYANEALFQAIIKDLLQAIDNCNNGVSCASANMLLVIIARARLQYLNSVMLIKFHKTNESIF